VPILEAALYSYLTQDPGVSAVVSDRVYAVRAPEHPVMPYIFWQTAGAQRFYTYDPYEVTQAYVRKRVRFFCVGSTALAALEAKEAVLFAMSGYEGDMSGVLVGQSSAELESDDYDPSNKTFVAIADFRIMYEDDLAAS